MFTRGVIISNRDCVGSLQHLNDQHQTVRCDKSGNNLQNTSQSNFTAIEYGHAINQFNTNNSAFAYAEAVVANDVGLCASG